MSPAMHDGSTWQPNLSWITGRMAVGGRFPLERAPDLVRSLRIAAVVDLRSEDRDEEAVLRAHGIAFLHLPTDDHCALSPVAIGAGVAFARTALARGERILIHCEHGIGRSATLALCVLVAEGHAPLAALALAKDRRALISPSPAQYECWVEWLRDYRRTHAVAWEPPGFEAFKAIAYRHLAQA